MRPERPNPPSTLAEAVARVERDLREAELSWGHGTDNPRDEAAWLVLAAIGLSPVTAADPARPLSGSEWLAVRRLLERRIRERRPLAYLTGRAWFAGLEFEVDARALVPRSPLSELIVERFAPWLPDHGPRRILEIGTGNGCIAVACALAFPEARIDAIDIDPEALALAYRNAARHGVEQRLELLQADVYEGLPAGRCYDLIVSNPPYVDAASMAALPAEYRHEPAHALAAGDDGLDVVARILEGAGTRIASNGVIVVEVGHGAAALERRYPRVPFTWLTLASPGIDVFVLTAEVLCSHSKDLLHSGT